MGAPRKNDLTPLGEEMERVLEAIGVSKAEAARRSFGGDPAYLQRALAGGSFGADKLESLIRELGVSPEDERALWAAWVVERTEGKDANARKLRAYYEQLLEEARAARTKKPGLWLRAYEAIKHRGAKKGKAPD